jgi:hypothetical protein
MYWVCFSSFFFLFSSLRAFVIVLNTAKKKRPIAVAWEAAFKVPSDGLGRRQRALNEAAFGQRKE